MELADTLSSCHPKTRRDAMSNEMRVKFSAGIAAHKSGSATG
jgi:hypothetical protein